MKVLFACPFAPWPLDNGGKTRTFHLIRAASRNAEIHLHVVREPDLSPEFEAALAPYCASIEVHDRSPASLFDRLRRPKIERWFHSDALTAAMARDIKAGGFDLVHLDELLLARVPPRPSPLPIVQHHHKLDTVFHAETARGSSLAVAFDAAKLSALERASTRITRHHVLCSEDDAAILTGRHGPLQTTIVANGFDPELFHPPGEDAPPRSPARILYLGSMDYAPNVDGVVWFCEEILPRIRARRPDAVLDIVGGNPAPEVRALASDAVVVHGRAETVLPALHRCALLAVPLRIGGGTRLKIAEALGAATPVVSTTIGAQGLGLRSGEHLLLADEPTGFADACVELLESPEHGGALAAKGRTHALANFTWKVLGERLLGAWENARLHPG